MFTYEKTYLFIAFEPICEMFSKILETIVKIKKLNYQKNYNDFKSFINLDIEQKFSQENEENVIQYFN